MVQYGPKWSAVGVTTVGVTAVRNNLKSERSQTSDLPSFSDYPCFALRTFYGFPIYIDNFRNVLILKSQN